MADGFCHRSELLGTLVLPDVVGAQNDVDGAVQRVSGRWGHRRYCPKAVDETGHLRAGVERNSSGWGPGAEHL